MPFGCKRQKVNGELDKHWRIMKRNVQHKMWNVNYINKFLYLLQQQATWRKL